MTSPTASRSRLLFAARVLFVRLRFIALLVLATLAVAYGDDLVREVERLARRPGSASPASILPASTSASEWYCPMHLQVVRDEPGNCPICGMTLVKRERSIDGAREAAPRVALTPGRIALAGIETAPVVRRPLERALDAVGTIEVDERRMAHLSARIAGRVEKLHVSFVGERVAAGDPIYDIYSPDLSSTERELLLALDAASRAQAGSASAAAQATLDAVRQRLLLWGMTPAQLAEIERKREPLTTLTVFSPSAGTVIEKDIHEGHYVKVGEDPYTVADLSLVWMVARVFEAEASLARIGAPVEIRAVALPGRVFAGHVSFVAPVVDRETRTVAVRADVANADGLLKPGMYVTARLSAPIGADGLVAAPGEKGIGGLRATIVYRCCESCPDIEMAAPGLCPRCGMPLTPVEKSLSDLAPPTATAAPLLWECRCNMHPGEVFRAAEPGRCSLCGAPLTRAIEPARPATHRSYTCPMDPEVVQDAPGACPRCGMALVPMTVYGSAAASWPLAVPVTAVIDTGGRTLVWREVETGTFEAAEVTLGPRAGAWYALVSGLQAGDRVAVAGAFLIDAEARLLPGTAFSGASGTMMNNDAHPSTMSTDGKR